MADLKIKILMEAAEKISAPFRRAMQSTDAMKAAMKSATDEVRKLEQTAKSIEAYQGIEAASKKNAAALAEAKAKAAEYAQKMLAADGGSQRAAASFAAAQRKVEKLTDKGSLLALNLSEIKKKLASAEISTDSFGEAQERLKRDLDAARAAAEKQGKVLGALKVKSDAIAAARAKMDRTMGTRGNMAIGGAAGMAAGGGALAAGAPLVSEAGDFEHNLAAYGLTAGQTGNQLQAVRDKLRGLSTEVNQSASDMLAGQTILVGKGLDPDAALGAIGTIGRAVTATGAEFTDMSNLAFSVMDNLKVPQAELARAFDVMAKSGDLGGFELKNMANTFPQLTAAAAGLGMTGTKAIGSLAAALQVATKGAANPEEAANNFANFLGAITKGETIRNFQKMGIDIAAAMKNGVEAGQDPIDVAMKQIGNAVGVDFEKEVADAVAAGGDAKAAADKLATKFNLSALFGDAQVQNFLAPMLANMKEFRRIREEAMGGDGTVDAKFSVMMKTYNEQTKGLGVDLKNAMEGIGNALLPVLMPVISGLREMAQGISRFTAANPGLTATLATVAGALAAVVAVGGALAVAIAGLLGPFAMARFALTAIGIQSGIAGGGVGVLSGAFGMLGTAATTVFPMLLTGIKAVGAAFLTNPLGIAITAIVLALGGLYAAFEPFRDLVDGVFAKIGKIFGFGGKDAPALEGDVNAAAAEGRAQIAAARPPVKIAPPPSAAAQAVVARGGAAAMAAPIDMGGVTIVVHAAPGMDTADLAKQVKAEFDKLAAQARVSARARMYDEED
jgi:TP901 family phage tail tape measure protein